MTSAQAKLLDSMRAGQRLWWFGDSGPELSGYEFWPSKRTVRALLASGVLRWKEYLNDAQRACGICEIVIDEVQE